jgi:hypothetical protein
LCVEFDLHAQLACGLRLGLHADAFAAGKAVSGRGLARPVRLGETAAAVARFAHRRSKTPFVRRMHRVRLTSPDARRLALSRPDEGKPSRPAWADLAWSLVVLLLLITAAYAALHASDLLADLEELRLLPGY